MKKTLFALLALVLFVAGCPSNAPDKPIDASMFEPALTVDAAVDGSAPHRLGSFNPTCTGTGIPKVVSGVQTSACATIVNADVSTSAAIAGTKITPDFGSQNIFTNGGYAAFGSPVAASGTAFRFATNQSAYAKTSGTDRCLWETSDAVLYLGNNASNTSQFSTINIYAYGGLNFGADASATTYLQMTGGQIVAWKPIVGSAGGSSPYAVHGLGSVALPTGAAATTALAAATYSNNTIQTTAALTANQTITLPAAADAAAYTKVINNICTGAFSVIVGASAGAATVTVANGKSAMVLVDSRGVTRLTPDT